MEGMAKKRMKTDTKPDAKKPPGRARDTGVTRIVTFEIPVDLDDAVEEYRQDEDRTKKSVMIMALKKLLTELGRWPPDAS